MTVDIFNSRKPQTYETTEGGKGKRGENREEVRRKFYLLDNADWAGHGNLCLAHGNHHHRHGNGDETSRHHLEMAKPNGHGETDRCN